MFLLCLFNVPCCFADTFGKQNIPNISILLVKVFLPWSCVNLCLIVGWLVSMITQKLLNRFPQNWMEETAVGLE